MWRHEPSGAIFRKSHQGRLGCVTAFFATLGLRLQVRCRACRTLVTFGDSDGASDRPARKSVSSWLILLGEALLSAGARTQSEIARSSCEVEYIRSHRSDLRSEIHTAWWTSSCDQTASRRSLWRFRHRDVKFLWLQVEIVAKRVTTSESARTEDCGRLKHSTCGPTVS